ncbi:hypothetical protein RI129_012621 [Pyrocoelia pectoralis]|uniref:Amine oxidase domain-containing protein n=1 Tax=Pyrocoelia pectoralis TaxID=417401 RepID=A0AAN7V449_9COLE
MSDFGRTNPSVIIIGAGASGTAAASKLYQNGIENITILEAENRIGGRIHSVAFDNLYIDLGAQWCHGEKGNVVYELVKDLDILKDDTFVTNLYHSSKGVIDEEFRNKIWEVFKSGKKAESLAKSLTESFEEEAWEDEGLAQECLEWLRKWALLNEGAFSWFNVSGRSDFEHCEGNLRLSWDGLGYKTILDILMCKFPVGRHPMPIESKIMLNKEVCQISWDEQAVVDCADGTTYVADHVIVTTSLGVLKNYHKTLFYPTLPQGKVEAIEVLGFDSVGKIYLHFPNRWWNDNFDNINFVWSEQDLEKTAEAFPHGPKKEGKSWITAIFAIHVVPKCPNLLVAQIAGEFVSEIENSPDELIIRGMGYILHKFLEKQHVPDKIIRENWYSNSHFHGAYSFQTVASQKRGCSQANILAQPLLTVDGKPTLLLAGEATHPKYYSTVHGAIQTGFREAERLIDFYK